LGPTLGMALRTQGLEAVLFDYGNTIIEFGPRQQQADQEVLHAELTRAFGPCDRVRLEEIRRAQIVAPYQNDCVEHTFHDVVAELVRQLYGQEATAEQVEALVRSRIASFIRVVEVRPEIIEVLQRMKSTHRIGLISNYPSGEAIRGSLDKLGLTPLFECIVVSGEVGRVKPHPAIYQSALDQLDLPPEACVYIGDNWLGDIQGAKRFDMQAVLTTEYVPYERFEPKPGDHEPDARISSLGDLATLLI